VRLMGGGTRFFWPAIVLMALIAVLWLWFG
jgi:hypothetical protein